MSIYANGMGGGLGRRLWPELEKLEAKRLCANPGTAGRDIHCDLEQLEPEAGSWFRPGDVFIFAAAVSKPDRCAADLDAAWKINVHNTTALIGRAVQRGAKVIFFSSDTVYGSQDGPLDEASPLAATENYGRMKAGVEEAFLDDPMFTALRLSYLITLIDVFSAYLAECAKTGQRAEVFGEYARNMVWLGDLRETVLRLSAAAMEGKDLPRAVNVGGPACVSRAEMALAFKNIVAGDLNFSEVSPPESFFQARPRTICLDISRLSALLGRAPLTICDAYREELKAQNSGE